MNRLNCADQLHVAVLQADVSYQHQYIISNNATSPFYGHVNVGIQENRANVSGCALNFSPCTFNGQVQTTMPTVQDIGFNMVQPTAFELAYQGAPNNSVATTNMADTHSIGYQVINSTSCGAVHFSNVTQDFFNYQYATYASGFQNQCNMTANFDSVKAFNGTQALTQLAGNATAYNLGTNEVQALNTVMPTVASA
eukprot:jgi/Astpho2/5134/Aster-06345